MVALSLCRVYRQQLPENVGHPIATEKPACPPHRPQIRRFDQRCAIFIGLNPQRYALKSRVVGNLQTQLDGRKWVEGIAINGSYK